LENKRKQLAGVLPRDFMPIKKPDEQLLHDPRDLQILDWLFAFLLVGLDGFDDERGRESANDLEKLFVVFVRPLFARSVHQRNLRHVLGRKEDESTPSKMAQR